MYFIIISSIYILHLFLLIHVQTKKNDKINPIQPSLKLNKESDFAAFAYLLLFSFIFIFHFLNMIGMAHQKPGFSL